MMLWLRRTLVRFDQGSAENPNPA